MKTPKFKLLIVSVGVGVMFFIAGARAPTYAQEGKHEQDARPEKQEQQRDRGQQEQHQEKQQQNKGQQERQEQAKDQQEHQEQAKDQQEHQQQAKGQQEQQQQETKDQNHQQQQINSQQKQQQQQTKGLQKKKQKRPKNANQPQQQAKPVSQTQQQAKVGLKKQQANQPSQPVQHIAQGEQKNVWQQHRAQNWQADHRTWQERGGYSGYRIPEDHYHGHFGQYHSFRIYSHSMEIYEGHPRFQYNGYWFGVLDPWPESWSDDWYENDDVYITYYGDGYYLYNRRHPGVGIAINVYVN
jgi:primosomal protein N'